MLGERINSVRVLPKRLRRPRPSRGRRLGPLGAARHAAPAYLIAGAGLVDRRRARRLGMQLNPDEAQVKDIPGSGAAIAGRELLADAGITPGVMKPFEVLVEHGGQRRRRSLAKLRARPGIVGATAPPRGTAGRTRLLEAFPPTDGDSLPGPGDRRPRRDRARRGPTARSAASPPRTATSSRPSTRNFPYVLAFVVLLTLLLLARAFRSLVLPLKAGVLNLSRSRPPTGSSCSSSSRGTARAIWNVARDPVDHPLDPADDLRLPVRALDGLRGLHADAGCARPTTRPAPHDKAIALGLARTGKLVTSAALILMFAFLVLSSSPGFDIKAVRDRRSPPGSSSTPPSSAPCSSPRSCDSSAAGTGGCPTGRASPSGSRAGSRYHRSRPKVRSTPGAGEEAHTARRAWGNSSGVDGTATRYRQTSRATPSSRTQDLAGMWVPRTQPPLRKACRNSYSNCTPFPHPCSPESRPRPRNSLASSFSPAARPASSSGCPSL